LERIEQLLSVLARIWETEEFVPVSRVHVSGVSYKTAGMHMIELLEDMVREGIRVRTYATLNPAGMDLELWREMGIPEEFARNQIRLVKAYEKLGIKPILTCAPYFCGNTPKFGEIVAFSESSAVITVNSLIGARTNRHGNLEALSAAILGKVPKYGLLLDENRVPTVKIDVPFELSSEAHYGLLGIVIGEKLRAEEVPIFYFHKPPFFSDLRLLGAALAASGSLALFHVADITPEAVRKRNFTAESQSMESITIDQNELKEAKERLFQKPEKIDLVAIGCPHASVKEILEIDKRLQNKRIKEDVHFWIFTSRYVKELLRKQGVLERLRRKNVKIFTDTCMVVSPIEYLGIKGIATNSAKAAWYIPRFSKGEIKVAIMSIQEIISEVAEVSKK